MTPADFDLENAEIITPPDEWRKKVRVMSKREAAKFDPIKAAEAALTRLAQKFPSWMASEADGLSKAFDAIAASGMSASTVDSLYQSAHNIKGQAETLGFPLVGSVAANLCHLIEAVPSHENIPLSLLEKHVVSIRAMVSEDARDSDNTTGAALLASLQQVTDDLLASLSSKEKD